MMSPFSVPLRQLLRNRISVKSCARLSLSQSEQLTRLFFIEHKLVLEFFEELGRAKLIQEECVSSLNIVDADLLGKRNDVMAGSRNSDQNVIPAWLCAYGTPSGPQ